MEMTSLLRRRIGAFRKEIAPYVFYVGRSGFFGFFIMMLIVSAILYANFLRNIPESFPFQWVAILLFVPLFYLSPIRTYLREPDLVYLLPLEAKMSAYFRHCLLRSGLIQSLGVILMLLAVWPLYIRLYGSAHESPLVLVLSLLIVKASHVYGSWVERQMSEKRDRFISHGVRLITAAASVYTLFTFPSVKGKLFILLLAITYVIALSLPRRYRVNWPELVEWERQHRGVYFTFFSWFVDVTELPSRVRRRSWIAGWTSRLHMVRRNTYLYLYMKTFARTELLGIVARLTLIGGLAVWMMDGMYTKVFFYSIFVFFAGMQLSSLDRYHRFVFWVLIYPLSVEYRRKALLTLVSWLHIMVAIVLLIPVMCTSKEMSTIVISMVAGVLITVIYRRRVLIRQWSDENFIE